MTADREPPPGSKGGKAETATPGMWPNGERQSVRDEFDKKSGEKKSEGE